MSSDEFEKNQIPIKKSGNSESRNLDPHQKKWRIVDLAEGRTSETGLKKDASPSYKRKSGLSFGAILGGAFNLLLIFGLGAAIYFGWVYYKNNYDGKLPFLGEKEEAPEDNDSKDEDSTSLQDEVDEIKDLLAPDSATTTDSAATTTVTSATSTVAEENVLKITSTPTGYLNVRNSPWGTIIGKVYPGEEYVYTDSKDNWYFIVIADKEGKDVSGWVYGEYVDKLE